MANFLSWKETRSRDQRAQDIKSELPKQIRNAKENTTGYSDTLQGIEPDDIQSLEELQRLPVLRKSDFIKRQGTKLLYEDFLAGKRKEDYIFQSPGPIYEPGFKNSDWWSLSRFLNAVGIGPSDIVQNCFSYHFTPAGKMMESGALHLGATVFPAGVGNTEQQAQVASALSVTSYCGTPEYLLSILNKAEELNLDVSTIKKAAVSGGPLFPQVRAEYVSRGISCLQAYATADIGAIAYESISDEPMIVDENVLVEIVLPGTGLLVPEGEIGEVLVTTLNSDYPLVRFATGDLSAIAPGYSKCGRTNIRLVGWRGRADQAVKIKGMFVRPEQVAVLRERHPEIGKVRVTVDLLKSKDVMTVKIEVPDKTVPLTDYEESARSVLKLGARVEIVPVGTLPSDGIVIEDRRPSTVEN